MQQLLKHIDSLFVNGLADSLIAIVFIILVAWVVGIIGRRLLAHLAVRNRQLAVRLFSVTVRFLAAMGIAQQFSAFKGLGTTLITSSGIIAVVLSLTAQETLNDIISGLLINYNRPYEIGDTVRVNDRLGTVTAISLPHTVIKTPNNSALVIPNSVMNSNAIENITKFKGPVNTFLKITVDRGADIAKAKRVMAAAVTGHRDFLDVRTPEQVKAKAAPVTVMVSNVTDTAVELSVPVWSKDYDTSWQQLSDLRQAIVTGLVRQGIQSPRVGFVPR